MKNRFWDNWDNEINVINENWPKTEISSFLIELDGTALVSDVVANVSTAELDW